MMPVFTPVTYMVYVTMTAASALVASGRLSVKLRSDDRWFRLIVRWRRDL